MSAGIEGGTGFATRRSVRIKEPEDWQVVLLDDDYTTMDFVVLVLMSIFHKTQDEATDLMLEVHRKGRGVAGIYPWDIAMTKANQVYTLAQENQFPLRCAVEPC